MHLTEGRNTGFRKILKALERNGSPLPEFITDDEHSFFITRLFIREDFYDESDNFNVTNDIVKIENVVEEYGNVVEEYGDTEDKSCRENDTNTASIADKSNSKSYELKISDTSNVIVKPGNVVVKHGGFDDEHKGEKALMFINSYDERKKDTAKTIVLEIIKNENQTLSQLAKNVGLSSRTVTRYVKEFQDAGVLLRSGGYKFGKWILK